MKRLAVVVFLVGLLAAPWAVVAQGTDPLSVVKAFNDAVNAHAVDAQLAFFADDAVAQFPNQPPPNLFTGKAQIREWLQNDAADHVHVESSNFQVSGNKVTFTARVAADELSQLGVASIEGTAEVVVQGGKIHSFIYTISPASLEQINAAIGAAPGMPRTGVPGSVSVLVLLVLAGLLVLLGLVARTTRVHTR